MKRWTADEVESLRRQYGKVVYTKIYINGRSWESIMWKAGALGLKSPNRWKLYSAAGRVWTPEQEQFLRENYGRMSASDIAQSLGRKLQSVYAHAYNLRLTVSSFKGVQRKPVTLSKEMLDIYSVGTSIERMSELFNLPVCAIRRGLERSGIMRRPEDVARANLQKAMERNRKDLASGLFAIRISAAQQGVPIEEWKGFTKSEAHRIQKTREWKQWRHKVFVRDRFKCQMCGHRNHRGCRRLLDPHHIIPKAKCPDLIFEVDNGVTLCRPCHQSIARKEHLWEQVFSSYVQSLKELEV